MSRCFFLFFLSGKTRSTSCFENGISFSDFAANWKILPIDPVFSNWFNFIEKVLVINFSRNSKSFKGFYFFFEIRTVRFFSKNFNCVYWLFYNCLLAMFHIKKLVDECFSDLFIRR